MFSRVNFFVVKLKAHGNAPRVIRDDVHHSDARDKLDDAATPLLHANTNIPLPLHSRIRLFVATCQRLPIRYTAEHARVL